MGEAPPSSDGAHGVTPAGVCGEQLTVSVIKTDPTQVLHRSGVAILAEGSLQPPGADPDGLGDLGDPDVLACVGVDERDSAAHRGRLNRTRWIVLRAGSSRRR